MSYCEMEYVQMKTIRKLGIPFIELQQPIYVDKNRMVRQVISRKFASLQQIKDFFGTAISNGKTIYIMNCDDRNEPKNLKSLFRLFAEKYKYGFDTSKLYSQCLVRYDII